MKVFFQLSLSEEKAYDTIPILSLDKNQMLLMVQDSKMEGFASTEKRVGTCA